MLQDFKSIFDHLSTLCMEGLNKSLSVDMFLFGIQKVLVNSKTIFLSLIGINQAVFFNCDNYKGIILITRLRLELSHLHQRKFKKNFQYCLNTLSSSVLNMGSTSHVLHFPIFNYIRHNLLTTSDRIDCKILEPVNSVLANSFSWQCIL